MSTSSRSIFEMVEQMVFGQKGIYVHQNGNKDSSSKRGIQSEM